MRNLWAAVNLATKSYTITGQLDMDKDIDIVRRVTSSHASPTTNKYSVEEPTSLEVAARRLSNVDSPTVIPRVTVMWSAVVLLP